MRRKQLKIRIFINDLNQNQINKTFAPLRFRVRVDLRLSIYRASVLSQWERIIKEEVEENAKCSWGTFHFVTANNR